MRRTVCIFPTVVDCAGPRFLQSHPPESSPLHGWPRKTRLKTRAGWHMSCPSHVVTLLLLVLALAGLLYRLTTSEDRARYLHLAVENFHQLRASATRPRPELDAFDAALRARTGQPFLTLALVAICGAALVMGWEPST